MHLRHLIQRIGHLQKFYLVDKVLLTLLLGKSRCLCCADLTLSLKITLVTNENDCDFLISMVSHFLKPFAYRLECCSSRYIIYKKDANSLAVISIRNSSVALLSGRVPDLRTNEYVLDRNIVCCELNADRCVSLSLELVLGVSKEQL